MRSQRPPAGLSSPAELLSRAAQSGLGRLARLLAPHLAHLDRQFERKVCRRYDAVERRALAAVTVGAAARLLVSGRDLPAYFEQVEYNGRRLARLNVALPDILRALEGYDGLAAALLAARCGDKSETLTPAREQLRLCSALALHEAFFQVREAETQAFYGLFRAEQEASGVGDLLVRSIGILTLTFRAQAGRLVAFDERSPIPAALRRRLARPRYIPEGSPAEELLLDPELRGKYRSYWSIPFFDGRALAGVVQFGFPKPFHWLPRELQLLDAITERCRMGLEKARMAEELARRAAEVRRLAGHLMSVEEEERSRIGRDLHDAAGQTLLTLRLQLDLLHKSVPRPLRARTAAARDLAGEIVAELRRLIAALSPAVLKQLGLSPALRQLTRRFQESGGPPVTLRIPQRPRRAPIAVETAIYRIAQECLQNIQRHARARRVNLCLRSSDKQVELVVQDDGAGFDVAAATSQTQSFGLAGMRERVTLLGGSMEIRSRPGAGSTVHVRLPVRQTEAADATCE